MTCFSQLGARIQHALRAFTPDDQTALTKTVRTYPKTDVYDLEKALTSLGIGEAVVTVLSEQGAPTPVAWTRMRSPRSLMGTIGNDAITAAAKTVPLQAKYGQTIDPRVGLRRSRRPRSYLPPALHRRPRARAAGAGPRRGSGEEPWRCRGQHGAEVLQSSAFKSFLRSAATVAGREITRSIFGTGTRRR